MVGGAGLIVMRRGLLAYWLLESATRAVKSKSPADVGVPLIVPVADKDRPAGSVPADTVHVYGGLPPVAVTVAPYVCPANPAGTEVVVMFIGGGGAGLIVMRNALVADWLFESPTRTVKSKSPAPVGIPAIAPVPESVIPAGSAPPETVHVYGGVPPVAATELLYACPTVP